MKYFYPKFLGITPSIKLILPSLLIIFVLGCNQRKLETHPGNLNQILANFHNPSSQKILIAAHRCMHTNYPENSLAAIQDAINSGIDIIEIDIRTTKDGKLVLMHDDKVNRTTNGKGKLKDFTLAELEMLKLKSKLNDSGKHKIPLAESALKLVHGKIMVDLDIKDAYIKQLVDLVHKTNTEEQVLFFDGNFAVLDSVLILDSTLMVMPRAHSLEEVKDIIKKYKPSVIHIDPGFYTEEVVQIIKESGARIWINSLGFTDVKAFIGLVGIGYSPLTDGGANIIQTDFPLLVLKYLKDKDLR